MSRLAAHRVLCGARRVPTLKLQRKRKAGPAY